MHKVKLLNKVGYPNVILVTKVCDVMCTTDKTNDKHLSNFNLHKNGMTYIFLNACLK